MNLDEPCFRVLTLDRLPARLTADEVAVLLGFQRHDIPKLVSKGLLKPLGTSGPNSVKYFAAAEIEKAAKDSSWLAQATTVSKERKSGKKMSKNIRGSHPASNQI